MQDLETRIFTTVFAGILIASPVAGLRPILALRFCFTSLPMPGIVNSPAFLVWLTASAENSSTMAAAFFLGRSNLSAK